MNIRVDKIEPTKRTPTGELLDHFIGGDIVESPAFETMRQARKFAIKESKKDIWWECVVCWYNDEWDLIGKDFYKEGKVVHSIRE